MKSKAITKHKEALKDDVRGYKECNECGKILPTDMFQLRKDTGKYRSTCKDCKNKYNLKLYHNNPQQKENHRKSSWKHAIKKHYGLTVEEFRELEEKQDYRCACCGKHKHDIQSHELYVDHCHVTMEIRGLLCQQCNSGIGLLGDNIEGVKKAYDYLIRFRD